MENNTFFSGIKAGMSIAIGYFPVALTFGLLAKTAGLSMIEATAMSIFVYAGASQYIALSLIADAVNPIANCHEYFRREHSTFSHDCLIK